MGNSCGALASRAVLAALLLPAADALAECTPAAANFVSIEGSVEVAHAEQTQWTPAARTLVLCQSDTIRVGPNSRAAVHLANDAVLRLDQNTTLRLVDVAAEPEKRSLLELVVGAFKSFSRSPRTMTVNTPYVNGMIEGTEFAMRVADGESQVQVFEGKVRAVNDRGQLALTRGQAASAKPGTAPEPDLRVAPDDAVRWTLYYPPVLALDASHLGAVPPSVEPALALAAGGDTAGALAALDQVPAGDRNAAYSVARAALHLNVGRAAEAEADLAAALAADPNAGLAFALRAILETVQNRRDAALADAANAVRLTNGAPAARVAESYALQSAFRIEEARDALLAAAAGAPKDALVLARLAELQLMLGERSKALDAALAAAAAAPALGRAVLVQGFAALAANRPAEARTAFQRAIELASADPLAHFGLGLATIKTGDLTTGRQELEAAVALDGSNALLRPYLGKAYYEEKRDPLAHQQYGIAGELDARDPTAYLYEAIAKQTANEPVAALHALQKSIELNDNRAVYRSRQLLDSDLAARGASVARVYSDLGFQQRALVEGWNAVNLDPGNFSAHRFLADSYAALPRHEIARVSELLQSQLLQPLSMTPIQPHLAEGNLFLVGSGGPGSLAFNEFNSVFNRDGLSLQTSGAAGENRTFSGESVVSGLWRNVSFSFGAFHYTTDGFRPNADQREDIADAFVQTELTPSTGLQFEYRHRDSQRGDLVQRFFETSYRPAERNDDDTDSYRFGLRQDFGTHSTVLASFIYQRRDYALFDDAPPEFGIGLIDSVRPDRAYTGELQYLFRSRYVNVTSGFGYVDMTSRIDTTLGFTPPPLFIFQTRTPEDTRHVNGYVYTYLKPWRTVTATLGWSGDFVKTQAAEIGSRDQLNPKFGITWEALPGTTLRAAAFRTYKRTLVTDQTLEPTQVAGFNQFFDGLNGTEAWRYGGAIDQRITRDVYAGVEFTRADLSVPYLDFGPPLFAGTPARAAWREDGVRSYLFWTPCERLALRAEYEFEAARRDIALPDGTTSVNTHRVPFGFSYFHPNGFSGALRTSYVQQEGVFEDMSGLAIMTPGATDFWLLDATVSYRLPKRHGFVSLGVTNLTDERFRYFETDRNNPQFQPARAVVARITLAFP